VAAAMEREEKGKKERRRGKKKIAAPTVVQGHQQGWCLPVHRDADRAATSTPQGASESGALLCTKDVRHPDILQSGPNMKYVSVEPICKNCFSKKLKSKNYTFLLPRKSKPAQRMYVAPPMLLLGL
jgi:hypothetical protein